MFRGRPRRHSSTSAGSSRAGTNPTTHAPCSAKAAAPNDAARRTLKQRAKKFLDQIKVTKIAAYADQTTRIHSGLKAFGMPTTLLIDAKGREIGRLVGPAEWDSDEAKTLIKAALAE